LIFGTENCYITAFIFEGEKGGREREVQRHSNRRGGVRKG